ncbi:MAG: hypothetical protein C0467_00320 [Planctomycetaceae bacterium]|nr:hypothetical protein [Planctomycetaceae bacterium]
MVTYTKGRVTLGIPSAWKEIPIPGATDILGFWSVEGKDVLNTTGVILVGKANDADINLDLKKVTITEDKQITIAGQSCRRVVMQDKGEKGGVGLPNARGKGIGIVVNKPGADGKYLVFMFVCAADQWEKMSPLFEASIASITIDGIGGGATTGNTGTVNVVYTDRGQEKPLEGATVIVGRQLHLLSPGVSAPVGGLLEQLGTIPGSVDVVRGDAMFLSGTTGANGAFTTNALPPGTYDVSVWKAGHVPIQNLRMTVPGGGVKAYVNPDTGVGAADRHRTLDTSKIFQMKPPNPAVPVIWGRIALGTRTVGSPNSDPVAGENVTILVGENLSLSSTGLTTVTDVVQGDVIYAEVKTNADGTFAIPMPTGAYSLLVWKQGYTPQTRVAVTVWPGQVFYTLLKDDAPGGTGRHQNLDTTTQNVPRKKLDAKPGIRGVVRLSDRGVRTAGDNVTILVGTELRLDHPIIPNATDKVIGKALIAQTKTNKEGEFFVPVPPGNYHLIAWKEGYIPHEFDPVAVPPGQYNVTLSYDTQPGSSGRHQRLDLSGVKQVSPQPGGVSLDPTVAPFLTLLIAPDPPQLTSRTAGNVTLSTPADWRTDKDTPADEGAWLTGNANKPEVYFAVLRDTAFDGLAALIAPKGVPDFVAGRAATSFEGKLKNEPGTRARLLVLTDAEPDGRRIAFLAKATEASWADHSPTFDAILNSVKFSGGSAPPKPPKPPVAEEKLKELASVARIPDFTAAFAYTAYEDRVLIADATGKAVSLGVAGRGKPVAKAFVEYLAGEPGVAAMLGEPVTYEMIALGNTVTFQVFRGGTLVLERATGKIWWNAHPKRPADLRPADEITRYPRVIFNGVRYEVMTYPDRVQFVDDAGKWSMAVKVGAPGQPIPEEFRKALEADKIDQAIGKAVSAVEPLFNTPARVQVYESGVMVLLPGTGQWWWARHMKRSAADPPLPRVIALPKDPTAVVVRLDYVGGYTPPRKTNDPFLQIRADGRVTLIDPFGSRKPIDVKLDPEGVLAFVKFAVEEKGFFAIDSAAMERTIKDEAKRRKLPTVLDMPTTVVTIRTADGVHEARCYAPDFYAEQIPTLKSVQDFQAVHKRLADYMEKLRGP